MTAPLFTQKHYEHVISELRRARSRPVGEGMSIEHITVATEFICRVFENDNPKFKPVKFVTSIMS
jgi:hypothetical protein